MTTSTDPFDQFLDPEIRAFLDDGDYATLDEWMADSDYVLTDDGDWAYPDDYADDDVAGYPVDAIGTIEGAMEASGWGE